MNLLSRTLLLPLLLLGLSRPEARAQAAANLLVKDGQKVAFMGDSITQFGWGQPGGYVKLAVSGLETLGVKIVPIPAGVSGNTSRDMLARVDRDVLGKQPDWMTLSCGVNDVWHGANGVDLETYKKNIASIVEQALAKGIKVEILTATMIGEDFPNANNQKLAAYNDFLRELAKEKGLPVGDLNAAFQKEIPIAAPGSHFTVDGVHMNPHGNRVMAEGVLRGLGATDEQVAKVKAAWDQAPDGASIMTQVSIQGMAPVPYHAFDDFPKMAADQKLDPTALKNSLLLKALGKVLQAHAADDPLDLTKLQPEIQAEFTREIVEFLAKPAASAPAPPKANP